jgi:hypothetical protein
MPSVADLVDGEALGRLASPAALAQGAALAGQVTCNWRRSGHYR